MKIRRILFIELNRIGDVVRSSFVLRALKKKYPDAYISCLLTESTHELLRKNPFVDDIFVWPHKKVREQFARQEHVNNIVASINRFITSLSIHKYDLVINPFSDWGALIVPMLKPKYILGKTVDGQGNTVVHGSETAKYYYILSNKAGLRAQANLHFTEITAMMLMDLDIELSEDEKKPEIFIGAEEEACAQQFYSSHHIDQDEFVVGIQIGTHDEKRQWKNENYRELIEQLQKVYNAKIIITGSSYDAETSIPAIIQSLTKQPAVAAGKTTLLEVSALITKMKLFISNDTGPMHIASAFGVPIIALLGREGSIPEQCRPWGAHHTVIIRSLVRDIHVDDVINAAGKYKN